MENYICVYVKGKLLKSVLTLMREKGIHRMTISEGRVRAT